MFRNTFQSGFLSIFYSLGSKPLDLWAEKVSEGAVSVVEDEELRSAAVELSGRVLANNFITCPPSQSQTLGIKLPVFVMIVKNMDQFFSFEVEVEDERHTTRRFRASNFQSKTVCEAELCTMPLTMEQGWNQLVLNLAELVPKAYGTRFVCLQRVTINSTCRLRRVYCSEQLLPEEQLPPEFRLFIPG